MAERRQRKYARKHIKSGLCPDCPRPVRAGEYYCIECLIRRRESARKRYGFLAWKISGMGRPPKEEH